MYIVIVTGGKYCYTNMHAYTHLQNVHSVPEAIIRSIELFCKVRCHQIWTERC